MAQYVPHTKHIVPDDFSSSRFRVSRDQPCPVCGKPDWCLSDGMTWAICQRAESAQPWGVAGWFHRLGATSKADSRPVAVRTSQCATQDAHAPASEKISPWTPNGNPVAVYYYNRPDGSPLYRKIRYKTPTGKVTPFQRFDPPRNLWIGGPGCMAGVPRVLYRNEQLAHHQRVFVVEGEKCADLFWDLGLMATCNDGGAGKWRPEFSQVLQGMDVVILPDHDEPGHKHGELVASSAYGVARSVRVVSLPGLGPKQDVYDTLPLCGEALEALKAAMAAQKIRPATGEIFTTAAGTLWTVNSLSHGFSQSLKAAAKALYAPDPSTGEMRPEKQAAKDRLLSIPARKLRANFATTASRLGCPDTLLKRYLGHACGDVLNEHYRRVCVDELRLVSDLMDRQNEGCGRKHSGILEGQEIAEG